MATDVHNEFLIHSFNLNIGLLIAKVRIYRKETKKVTRFSPYPSALLNLRNCLTNITSATRLASKSENGILYHTPAAPKKRGKIINAGSRKSIWRVRERKIALLAIQIGRAHV